MDTLADRLHGTLEDVIRLALQRLPDPGQSIDDAYWRELAEATTLTEPTLRGFLAELASEE